MLTQNDLAFSDSDMWNFSSSIAFIRPPKTVGESLVISVNCVESGIVMALILVMLLG